MCTAFEWHVDRPPPLRSIDTEPADATWPVCGRQKRLLSSWLVGWAAGQSMQKSTRSPSPQLRSEGGNGGSAWAPSRTGEATSLAHLDRQSVGLILRFASRNIDPPALRPSYPRVNPGSRPSQLAQPVNRSSIHLAPTRPSDAPCRAQASAVWSSVISRPAVKCFALSGWRAAPSYRVLEALHERERQRR